ncbi:MAG: ATP-binding protein [Bacteroidales bacterium]|jgi:serine/threonine-protein kinase RsbW|nr:ATP-binding protein [Bacteroidales bacterium]
MERKIRIESKLSNLAAVENSIDEITRDAGINKDNYGKILVSVLEAVNNAIVHGNKSDETKYVDITILLKDDVLEITVEDEGLGFKPEEVPDPTNPENVERTNGRGVFLMKNLADEIHFNRKGNKVRLKYLNIHN